MLEQREWSRGTQGNELFNVRNQCSRSTITQAIAKIQQTDRQHSESIHRGAREALHSFKAIVLVPLRPSWGWWSADLKLRWCTRCLCSWWGGISRSWGSIAVPSKTSKLDRILDGICASKGLWRKNNLPFLGLIGWLIIKLAYVIPKLQEVTRELKS